MLITFRTKANADITMLGDVAIALLKLMGQSGGVPGALIGADVPAALQNLKAGIATSGDEPAPRDAHEDEEPPVTMRQRAFPLIGLLESAANANADVLWGEATSLRSPRDQT